MMNFLKYTTLMTSVLAVCSCTQVGLSDLRCEYLTEPMGIDVTAPRFSWTYTGNKDFTQKSVTLILSDDIDEVKNETDLLFRTEETTDAQLLQPELGKILKPHTTYWWKLITSGTDGSEQISAIQKFETAKFCPEDWEATWISDGKTKDEKPSPLFRKEFNLGKKVDEARLYICGLGYYTAWINGEKVGDREMDPAYTHFDKRNYYATYDVTSLLQEGENSIAAVLGNGWLNIQTLAVWRFDTAGWRQRPLMIAELRVRYEDGTEEIITTDESWKTSEGAYRANNIYCGDVYDASMEEKGWKTAGFDDAAWSAAVQVDAPAEIFRSSMFDPIRVCEELPAISMNKISDHLYVFDFGKNMAGTASIRAKGEKGTELHIRYAEKLAASGRTDSESIAIFLHRKDNNEPLEPVEGEEFQMDTYRLSGEGTEEFTPSFNYNGFRYVEVEGDRPFIMEEDGATALFVHTDLQQVGKFSCSNDKLNQLWEMTMNSYLSNFHSIPTDCPQREKNGWTADAWLAIDLGLLNYDGIKIYEKWMEDFFDNIHEDGRISGIIPSHNWGYADWIGPVWDAALFIIPEALYNYYGDKTAIERLYPVFVKYLEYLETRKDADGLVTYGIGDWMPYDTWTPTQFTTPCYCYLMNVLMDKFGKILGKEDHGRYAQRAAELKENINAVWFHPESCSYANASLSSYGLPLFLGIVPEACEEQMVHQLVELVRSKDYKMDCGTIGSKTLLRVLTKYGYHEDAYKMAVQPEVPGWMAWIGQGMTTLPEHWVIGKSEGASLNHVFLGDIAAWMTNDIAGINLDPEHPGFSHFIIRPHFMEELDWAEAEYKSVKGLIKVFWKKKGNAVELEVTVPSNTTATIYAGETVTVGGGQHHFGFKLEK